MVQWHVFWLYQCICSKIYIWKNVLSKNGNLPPAPPHPLPYLLQPNLTWPKMQCSTWYFELKYQYFIAFVDVIFLFVLQTKFSFLPGILRNKTMDDKFMKIIHFRLLVKKFGHCYFGTKQSKFNKSIHWEKCTSIHWLLSYPIGSLININETRMRNP